MRLSTRPATTWKPARITSGALASGNWTNYYDKLFKKLAQNARRTNCWTLFSMTTANSNAGRNGRSGRGCRRGVEDLCKHFVRSGKPGRPAAFLRRGSGCQKGRLTATNPSKTNPSQPLFPIFEFAPAYIVKFFALPANGNGSTIIAAFPSQQIFGGFLLAQRAQLVTINLGP